MAGNVRGTYKHGGVLMIYGGGWFGSTLAWDCLSQLLPEM